MEGEQRIMDMGSEIRVIQVELTEEAEPIEEVEQTTPVRERIRQAAVAHAEKAGAGKR